MISLIGTFLVPTLLAEQDKTNLQRLDDTMPRATKITIQRYNTQKFKWEIAPLNRIQFDGNTLVIGGEFKIFVHGVEAHHHKSYRRSEEENG